MQVWGSHLLVHPGQRNPDRRGVHTRSLHPGQERLQGAAASTSLSCRQDQRPALERWNPSRQEGGPHLFVHAGQERLQVAAAAHALQRSCQVPQRLERAGPVPDPLLARLRLPAPHIRAALVWTLGLRGPVAPTCCVLACTSRSAALPCTLKAALLPP